VEGEKTYKESIPNEPRKKVVKKELTALYFFEEKLKQSKEIQKRKAYLNDREQKNN
jgi:hypothetical protein